jgi:tetratricopeptide (TPR) repeat protein
MSPAAVMLLTLLSAPVVFATDVEPRFREANDLARRGDYPKAVALYQELVASGDGSASLLWNWAQAARARGAPGEALFALLSAREMDPGDRSVVREIEELRRDANLDAAEIAPEPLAAIARFARRFHLDLLSVVLAGLSVLAHAFGRFVRAAWKAPLTWTLAGLALAAAAAPVAGSFARPLGVVVRRGAPLLDSASPTAEPQGALREGEVVPILDASDGYLRVEDSSGARGWARADDVRRLARADGS